MKILAMADLHGNLPDVGAYLDDTDVVVIAGDIAPEHSSRPKENASYQTEWLNTKFYTWATKLNKPIYGCYGNHDYGFLTVENPKIHLHTNKIVDNFYLFAWTIEYGGYNYMVKDFDDDIPLNRKEGSIESRLGSKFWGCSGEIIPPIWVCHGPPFGICDGHGYGSQALYEAIKRYQPKAVFCGHIHHGAKRGQIGVSKIFNCSIVDNALDFIREPVFVEIDV